MNNRNEAKMNMYDAVINHFNSNPAIVTTIPPFQTALTAFTSKFSSISATAQLEMQVISGITLDKADLKKKLSQQAADIAAAVFAFASTTNDNGLREKVRYPYSKLVLLKDELLTPACQNIHGAANANIASLAPYGITAATLTSFQNAIDNYTDSIPAPRNAATQKKAYALSLKTLFQEADDILKNQMDKIAPQFKAANMLFYNTYKNNRIILDPAQSATKVEGNVKQFETSNPIVGAQVDAEGTAYTTLTDELGNYSLKIPVPGTYNIIFKHENFKELVKENIVVTLGQSTELNVEMEKI